MFSFFYIFLILNFAFKCDSDFIKCIADCVKLSECYEAMKFLKENGTRPQICSFSDSEPHVCCAEQDEETLFNIHYDGLRKSAKKCKEIYPPSIPHRNKALPEPFYLGTNGQVANDIKFMVALGYGNIQKPVYRCGGFLIEPNVVITAAHCTEINGEPPLAVRIGSNPLSSNSTEPIKILKIVSHPNYNSQTYINDIAIIFLEVNSKESPACLFNQRLRLRHDSRTFAVGFGTTFFGGPFSNELIKVYMKIINKNICEKEFDGQIILDSQLCALGETRYYKNGTSGIQDTCQGDSGGPLILDRNDKYIVGIVSYGRSCGTEAPSVFTYIAPYSTWIDSVIRLEGNKQGLHDCPKLKPPYLTIKTCNKGVENGISCNNYALVGDQSQPGFSRKYLQQTIVALGYGDINNPYYGCDGVLIDHNVVLTAAQCASINGKPPLLVRFGIFMSNGIKPIRVVKVIQHPNYDNQNYLNDIAVVFLAENAEGRPRCLVTSTKSLYSTYTQGFSFGSTNFDGPHIVDLIEFDMQVVNKSYCENNNKGKSLLNTQLCFTVKTEFVDEDTFQGNSGGPIIQNNIEIISIISYGQGPGIYTNILSHLDWIESVVWPKETQEERFYVANK